jgi:hypothetical protein
VQTAKPSDQSRVTTSSYLYDSALHAQSYYAYNDREIVNFSDVYGAKFSPDGRLLFQPTTNGIDILDGYLGNLLTRISLPFALSPNYDALIADGTDNVLVAITGTGNGVAVIDLTSIAEPPALPYDRGIGPKSSIELSNTGEGRNLESPVHRESIPVRGGRHVIAPFSKSETVTSY